MPDAGSAPATALATAAVAAIAGTALVHRIALSGPHTSSTGGAVGLTFGTAAGPS